MRMKPQRFVVDGRIPAEQAILSGSKQYFWYPDKTEDVKDLSCT